MKLDSRLISIPHSVTKGRQGGEYHLNAEEYIKTITISNDLCRTNVVGVELDGSTWRNINAAGVEIDNSIVKMSPCLAGIHDVTVDGQAMVQIPKFYFLYQQTDTGHRWWIANHYFIIKGVGAAQVHKGFVYNGVEKPAFQVGAYHVSKESNTKTQSKQGASVWYGAGLSFITYCANRGNNFAMWNNWQYNALKILILIDTRTLLNSLSIWRGINHWNEYYSQLQGIYVRGTRYACWMDAGDSNSQIFNETVSAGVHITVNGFSPAMLREGLFMPISTGNGGANLATNVDFTLKTGSGNIPTSVSEHILKYYFSASNVTDDDNTTRLARPVDESELSS